jgi:hypothetical protein
VLGGAEFSEVGAGGLAISGQATVVKSGETGIYKFQKLAAWSPGMVAYGSFAGRH